MRITHRFDSGICPNYRIEGDTIHFDLTEPPKLLNVIVSDTPDSMEIQFIFKDVDEDDEGEMMPGQGLLVSTTAGKWQSHETTVVDERTVRTTIPTSENQALLATRYPYGRDGLDNLLSWASDAPVTVRVRQCGNRQFPEFQFGDNDADTVHYIIAGEDAAETAGSIVADGIVRTLGTDPELRSKFDDSTSIRVVPLTSPYSAAMISEVGCRSYLTPDGDSIYGAATWRDDSPPHEYAILRDQVTALAEANRLGLCLTLHSWQGQSPYHQIETIRSAGANELSKTRVSWGEQAMETLTEDIPSHQISLPDAIWHEGLARDYTLRELNVATFRTEVSTHHTVIGGIEDLDAYAERFSQNLATLDDLSGVYA